MRQSNLVAKHRCINIPCAATILNCLICPRSWCQAVAGYSSQELVKSKAANWFLCKCSYILKHSEVLYTTSPQSIARFRFIFSRPQEISLHISFPSRNMRLWKKISRSRLEPWDVERKNLALVSNPEMLRKKSRSRLELWDVEKKISFSSRTLRFEEENSRSCLEPWDWEWTKMKSKMTAFHLLVLFARQW